MVRAEVYVFSTEGHHRGRGWGAVVLFFVNTKVNIGTVYRNVLGHQTLTGVCLYQLYPNL